MSRCAPPPRNSTVASAQARTAAHPPPGHVHQVWGEGPRSTKKHLPSSLGQEPVHFHSSRGCVTLLLNPKGEVSVHPS